jgi:hypothetical protein
MATDPLELCPRCARRPIEHDETGWCIECASQHTVEAYQEAEAEKVDKRRHRWAARGKLSESPEALRERQRKHRLYAAVQPREHPDANTDPWELAFEGLQHLKKIRASILKATNGEQHFEAVQEIIRQLAVGPQDDAPVFDVTTRSGRMKRSMHRRWHVRGNRPCNCRP